MKTIRANRVLGLDSAVQVRESEDELVVPAMLTRESILPFCEGRGYRSADELRASAFTLEGAWIVAYEHIDSVFVMDRGQIRGQVREVRFDSAGNSVKGDFHFFKAACDQAFLEGVKAGSLVDVSVAYYCEEDWTPGEFGGEPYDFVQKNFMFGHVAAGVPEGRCPSPFCGMGCDSFLVKSQRRFVCDKFVRFPVRDPGLFERSLRTVVLNSDLGVHAVVGKLKGAAKGTVVQDYLFDLAKGWTSEKAQAWVRENKDSADFTTSEVSLDARSSLDPSAVLARSRELLGNMSSTGDRFGVAEWRRHDGARHHDGAL